MPCNSCTALNDDLYKARDEIALLKLNASLPCVLCESLFAEINELNLTHTTCVEQFEHARAQNNEIKSLSSTICSVMKSDDALLAPNGNHDALDDILDIDASIIICTSCIDLRIEVEALKQVRNDMSAKLVEHKDMSAL